MPTKYLDEEGLSHVVRRAKETFADKKELWNWQKTEKAGAVAFTPVPDSVLEPVVEFKFKETLPAEGEKGPENPSTIEGVNSVMVTRCGKNLCPTSTLYRNYNDITVVSNSDGSLTLNGTAKNDIDFYAELYHKFNGVNDNSLVLKNEVEYTVSISGDSGIRFYLYKTSSTTEDRAYGNPYINIVSGETASIVLPPETTGLIFRVIVPAGTTVDNATVKIQLEEGNSVTAFEPYCGTNYVISLGNTYYGGIVDIASGFMTITHLGFAFDGTEEWRTIGNVGAESDTFRHDLINSSFPELRRHVGWPTCSHFLTETNTGSLRAYLSGIFQETTWFFVVVDTNAVYSTNEAWKAFLATQYSNGTPVTIAYELETPFDVQLSPNQIKSLASDKYVPQLNTVYTDQKSIQVGYQKFADIDGAVHTTGDETIDGIKTIVNTRPAARAGETVTSIYFRNPEVTRGVLHPTGRSWTQMLFLDANGEPETNQAGRLGMFELVSPSSATANSSESMAFACYKFTDNPNEYHVSSALKVGFDVNKIPYATAPSTSIDRDSGTDIVTRDWLPKDTRIPQKTDLWNWQKTEKNGAVTFKPTSKSPIESIISFKFSETLPAEGEKGPENPSTIAGINEIHLGRCGKNILKPLPSGTTTKQGVTISTNGDGIYTLNGTSTGQIFHHIERFCANWFQEGVPYTASTSMSQANDAFQIWVGNSAYGGGYLGKLATNVPTKTLDSNVAIYIPSGATLNNVVCNPQIEYGTQATSFETGEGNSYSVSLGNTYYGGEINLATGVMTVTWYGIVYTGTETWDGPDNHSANGVECYSFALHIPSELKALSRNDGQDETNAFCSHFNYVPDTALTTNHFYIPGSGAYPAYFTTFCKTLDNWKTWVQEQYANGHPLTLTYKLNTPFTVQLTIEQILSLVNSDKYSPRINTIYTDAESVQVGYQRYVNEDNFVDKESRIPEDEIDEAFAE